MIALLLGKPFHGEKRKVDRASETLKLEAEVIESTKGGDPGQCSWKTPRRACVVTYHRVRPRGAPDGALVYVRAGYEPDEEDAGLVRRAFG